MKKKAKKITFKQLTPYSEIYTICNSSKENIIVLNGKELNVNDLGAGVLRWLSNYARSNRVHSDSIYTMLLKNKKYYLSNKKRCDL